MPPIPLPDPPLTDGVVTLRPLTPADAPAVIAGCRDPDVARWTGVPNPYEPRDYDAWLHESERQRTSGTGLHLLVVDGDDRVLGAVGISQVGSEGAPDIGYWAAPEARGQGHTARAVRLLRDWAARELGLERVDVLVHRDNEASQAVARAAGFSETGEYRPCPRARVRTDEPDFKVFAWPQAGAGAG